mgnify:CR=1 FL=1
MASVSFHGRRFRAKRRSTTHHRVLKGKADLVGRLANDLAVDEGGGTRFSAGEACIGKGLRHEGKRAPRQAQDRNSTVAILDAGGLRIEDEGATVRIDYGLAFAAFHLLACVVATRAAGLGSLDALAVEHDRAGRGLAPGPLAVHHDETMVDFGEDAVVAETAKVAEHRALGW